MPWYCSIMQTKFVARRRLSIVPASIQVKPRPSSCACSLSSFRYISLRVVISSSPRSEGFTLAAISLTPAG